MTEPTAKTLPTIPDTDVLQCPENQVPLVGRIRMLSTQQCTASWMMTEIAAIAILLKEGRITAGTLWQLVLKRYNIASSVSSTPRPDDDPQGLTQPLAERALVWEHLTALCSGHELASVPALLGPYDEETAETVALRDQVLDFHARSLNLLRSRFGAGLGVEDFLGRLGHGMRHDIEHYLAIQWLGGSFAVGASLHGLPLSGGSFGLDEQPVYVIKALVEALKRDIAELQDANIIDSESVLSREALGRAHFWWMLLKGYTYDMVRTHQGRIVVAMLAEYPDLVEDLKRVLALGLELSNSGKGMTPEWGSGRSDCVLQNTIAETPTSQLIERLDARVEHARKEAVARRNFQRNG